MQVRPLNTFSRLMAQMTRTHACVPFLALVNIAANLEDQIVQKPNFGGVNRHFPAKLVKY